MINYKEFYLECMKKDTDTLIDERRYFYQYACEILNTISVEDADEDDENDTFFDLTTIYSIIDRVLLDRGFYFVGAFLWSLKLN